MNASRKKTYSREEINTLKFQWQQSGLSKKMFSEEHGIKYYTFIGWFDGDVKQPKGFMPVQIQLTGAAVCGNTVQWKDHSLLPAFSGRIFFIADKVKCSFHSATGCGTLCIADHAICAKALTA